MTRFFGRYMRMIKLNNRLVLNSVITDKKRLKKDLHALRDVLFESFGVIGVRVIGSPYMLIRILEKESMRYRFYHVISDVYVIVCRDISKEKFDSFYLKVKYQLKIRYDGAVSIYNLYSCDEPQPEQMIKKVLKLIQVNQDVLEISAEQRDIMIELKKKRYIMYLQPKADSQTGRITGAEALVRYRSENGSIFPPTRFISELEQKGLIFYIDIFIFEETCRLLRHWQEIGHELYPISLNFSKVTMMHEDLIKTMNEIQERYGVPRSLLEIEITESMEMMDKEKLKQIGYQIKESGYRLSLDDFGVSFSNVSILSLLNFDTLKVDKSIIEDICRNEKLQVIIKGLIEVCHKLDIQVVAEGIETKKQMKALFQLGCNCVQGYLIGRPVSAEIFEKIYVTNKEKVVKNVSERKHDKRIVQEML